ncbi:MAG: VOC family protein [Nitrososphaera sp.]|jgi:catechol 2,3-dioxygenase
MKIGHVSINVSSIEDSIEFYRSVLGFRLLGRPSSERALLTSDGNSSHLLELLQAKPGKDDQAAKRAGLYHFAILVPDRKHLADMLVNLGEKRDRMHFDGLADHLVSESIYIRDPDFNGIEIYRDRPAPEWSWNGGRVGMSTLPLDTDNLLKESSTEKGWKEMPAGTTIGHVHLHVRDLAKATEFYHKVLGLNVTAALPGAAFFAAGRYHHHIAANTWRGASSSGITAPALPDGTGLNHFSIVLQGKKEFERVREQLSRSGSSVTELSETSAFVYDADGIMIKIQA